MKKILSAFLAIFILLSFFTGCAKKTDAEEGEKALSAEEQAILSDLEKEFSVKGIEREVAEGLRGDGSTSRELAKYGIRLNDYIKGIMKHYSFEYGSVSVKDTNGTAKVTMTFPDFKKMNQMLEEQSQAWMKENGGAGNVTDEEFYPVYGKLILELLDSEDFPTLSETFTVAYVKENGTWKIADRASLQKAIVKAQGG